MELIESEPLSALLARAGRLGLERIVALAALAVGAAHGVGLVHRATSSRATCSCAVTGW